MTEPVQPLTWQKRTNHEEHMQFFSKINEIVGQLSGTVERSETALADAEEALTDAQEAVATANTASAAASSAAQTVAGYNTRLTAAESGVAANTANIGQLDIETQDLYDRDAQSVKLAADHVQTITGGLNLQGTNHAANTTVGGDDTQIANGHRVIQELNAYAPMVRTTGNQTITGRKAFALPVSEGSHTSYRNYVKFTDIQRETIAETRNYVRAVIDSNDRTLVSEECGKDAGGNRSYYAIAFGGIEIDGVFRTAQMRINLSSSGVNMQIFDPINTVWRTVVLQ